MDAAVLRVLRMLADGVRGPRVHDVLDQLEAAGNVPAAPAKLAPTLQAPAAPPRSVPSPLGGTQ